MCDARHQNKCIICIYKLIRQFWYSAICVIANKCTDICIKKWDFLYKNNKFIVFLGDRKINIKHAKYTKNYKPKKNIKNIYKVK